MEDSQVQIRRNLATKNSNSRTHLSRYGKGKGSSTRLAKYNTNSRSTSGLHKNTSGSSQSLESINSQGSNNSNNSGNTHNSDHINGSGHGTTSITRTNSKILDNTSGSHRMTKRAANHPMGNALAPHRYKGLNSGLGNLAQSYRKPVIRLERDDDEENEESHSSDSNEFEDLDEDTDGVEEEKVDSRKRLNIGIQPVEPTPPKLSDETVISVSSFADMASALKGARDKSGFVNDADLISTAVNRSKNLGDMAQMVHGWGSSSSGRAAMAGASIHTSTSASNMKRNQSRNFGSIPGGDDPREFEKVFREYTNTRAIRNPVISSLCRISIAHPPPSNEVPSDHSASSASLHSYTTDNSLSSSLGTLNGNFSHSQGLHSGSFGKQSRLQLPSVKKVNSLVATTSHQISDYSERGNILLPEGYSSMPQSRGPTGGGVSTYILNQIWQSGWVDPEASRDTVRRDESIHGQAIRVQTRLAKAKERMPQGRGSSLRLSSMH